MRDAKLIKTGQIALADIDTDNRLRPVTMPAVESLVASIEQLGYMKDEVHLRRIAHQGNRLRLIAGGHRYAAAMALGWETLPAKVWDCSDNWARLLEIDDNLASADLSALDLAVFLAERKRVYEKLHPETRKGFAGAMGRWDATELSSFATTAAEARGISERHIRSIVAVGARLSAGEINTLRDAKAPVTLKELKALSKVKERGLRADVVGRIADGKAVSLAEAIRSVQRPKPPVDRIDQAHIKLLNFWKRAPKEARRRFVLDIADELAALQAETAPIPNLKVVK